MRRLGPLVLPLLFPLHLPLNLQNAVARQPRHEIDERLVLFSMLVQTFQFAEGMFAEHPGWISFQEPIYQDLLCRDQSFHSDVQLDVFLAATAVAARTAKL